MHFKKISREDISIDRRELAARLSVPSSALGSEYDSVIDTVVRASSPAYVAERVNIQYDNDAVIIGGVRVVSKALVTFLHGNSTCYLLCATLGADVDRFIMRYTGTSVYNAFVVDAVSDALIEGVCDLAEREVYPDVESVRFSPGYADLPIDFSKEIVAMLDGARALGIRFTESGMMLPRKTVSAIICVKADNK